MAKIDKESGPSDLRQPGEPLHLLQAEVVPGSNPEKANEATTKAVVEADMTEEQREERREAEAEAQEVEVAERRAEREADEEEGDVEPAEEGDLTPSDGGFLSPEEEERREAAEAAEAAEAEEADDEVVGPTDTTVAYDPSLYTVNEVNAYLDERFQAGDDEEVRRVLDAELAGKARTGVLDKHTRPE